MKTLARTLAALAIAGTTTSALAYEEYVGPFNDAFAYKVGSAPHAATNSVNTEGYGFFDFASSPAPSISYTPGVIPSILAVTPENSQTVVGTLRYSFTISGTAGEYVPVNFNGRVELQTGGSIVPTYPTPTGNTNSVGANFVIASSPTNYVSGIFVVGGTSKGFGYGEWNPAVQSKPWTFTGVTGGTPGVITDSISANIKDMQPGDNVATTSPQFNWLAGNFTGTLLMKIGANGQATGNVGMQLWGSNAVAGDQFVPFVLGGGYIDPYLSIDPTYLKDHPTVALNVEQGVGNIAPVPEPETWALLLAGLGLMGSVARRRATKQA